MRRPLIILLSLGALIAGASLAAIAAFMIDQTVTGISAPTTTTEPPPPTETKPSGKTLTVEGTWNCIGVVNYDLVQVTNHGSANGVNLEKGCTGRIGRLEVRGVVNGDAIKGQSTNIGAVPHDLVVESGYAACAGPSTSGIHQDGAQIMGGSNILFKNFVFDCYGDGAGNWFVQRAAGSSTPTAVICEHCAFGPRHVNNVFFGKGSVRSGVRDSLVCRPTNGRKPFQGSATDPVNEGNTVVPSNEPRCASLESLIAATR